MQSNIRLAGEQDLPQVEAIVEAAYSAYIPRIGKKPGPMLDDYAAHVKAHQLFVLAVDEGVAGIVVLVQEGEVMLLDNVALDPAFQGRGLGRQLMHFAEESALAAGCSSIRLYTHEAMSENLALYARLGYLETHRAEEHGFRRVFMAKTLVGLTA